MNLIIANNQSIFDEAAANQILLQLSEKPNSVIAFATGSTPLGMYKKLVAWYKNGMIDFSQIHAFNLDEFADIDIFSKNSFFSFLKKNLYDLVNIKPDHIQPIQSAVGSIDEICSSYENKIKDCGGLDLAILGIGLNGHIGYNEPGTPFHSLTHWTTLTAATIEANKKLFNEMNETPKQGITMGIKTIMGAKKILLLANGEEKAEVLQKALYGPITEEVPASVLQMHSNMVTILDCRAAKYLGETV